MKTRTINKFALIIASCFLAQQVLADDIPTDRLIVNVKNNYKAKDGSTYNLLCYASSYSGSFVQDVTPGYLTYGGTGTTISDMNYKDINFRIHCDILSAKLSAFKSSQYYFEEIFYLTFMQGTPGATYLPSFNPPGTQIDVTVPTGPVPDQTYNRRVWTGEISLENSPF